MFRMWRQSAFTAAILLTAAKVASAGEVDAPAASDQLAVLGLPPRVVVASWYGGHHEGRPTSSGEIHSRRLRTAAHRDLPFGTLLRVTNLKNGKTCIVKVNDRGPFVRGREIDLSERAARDLAMMADGLASVRIEVLPGKRPNP